MFGFRGAIARVAAFWYSHALFPLTPALSLRERENQGPRYDNSKRLGLSDALPMLLPLPEGEGRGEGERASESAGSGNFSIVSPPSDFFRISAIGFRPSMPRCPLHSHGPAGRRL